MRTAVKILASLPLGALLLCTSGCVTNNTVQYAKGHPENATWFTFVYDDKTNVPPDPQRHPAYYLLMPLTVPADMATFPIQFIDYWGELLSGKGLQ